MFHLFIISFIDSSQSTSQNRRESVSSCDFNLVQLTGEQDSRVLTLAEQIIAAIPDRIKVCRLPPYL